MIYKKVILFPIILSLFLSCVGKSSDSEAESTAVEYPDQESWNSTVTITNEGKMVSVVQAAHYVKYAKRNMSYISEGLKADFYNEHGQHTSVLTSEGGEVNDLLQDMIAYGNVIVKSDSGTTLYSDTLKWDNKRQKIISEIPVMITSDTDTLYGDSFISDQNLENYEITNSRGTGSSMLRK
jgi:LPS export ABC transporter protein LptC